MASLVELSATPLARMEQWRESDMHVYDEWGRAIAAGDWLSATVRVPMHSWHRGVAHQYFEDHPEVRAAIEREAMSQGREPDELLWARWMHLPQFYQDPLYPYLVGLTYCVAGTKPEYVLGWQALLGVLSIVLVWHLTRRYFGEVAGLVAGCLAVLGGPLAFYELLLLRDSVIVFTGLLLIWLLDRALARGGWARFAALGFAVGVACLLKSTFLLVAVVLAVALAVHAGAGWRTAVRPIAALAAGFAVALAPLAARNTAVGVPPLSLATSGPLTFLSSNDARYLPEVGFGIDTPLLARFLGDTSGGWVPSITTSLQSHTIASYGALVWGKWDRVWHWYEIPNNENYYYMARQVKMIGRLPVTFGVVAPLALVGLVLAVRRRRDVWPLYLLAATALAPMLIFYVLARFRLPLETAALPFAAFTVVEIAKWIEARQFGRSAVAIASLVLIAAWTGRALAPNQRLIRMADWILPYSVYYQPRISTAVDAKDWATAGASYVEFFRRYEPSDAEIAASADRTLTTELADMHVECAQILKLSGQSELANTELQRADHLQHLNSFPNPTN